MKNQVRNIIIPVLALVAFVVIAFVVPFSRKAPFWVALIFGIIGIAVGTLGVFMAFGKEQSPASKFYGFPIARITVVYTVVQLIVSFLFMGLAAFLPTWIAVIVCFVLLIAAAIGLVAADMTRDTIEEMDVKQVDDTRSFLALRSKAGALEGYSWNDETKIEMRKLAEEFQYSDPVSTASVADKEAELNVLLDELQAALMDRSRDGMRLLCGQTRSLLAERNRLCKLGKK